jgi:hypothetical protein
MRHGVSSEREQMRVLRQITIAGDSVRDASYSPEAIVRSCRLIETSRPHFVLGADIKEASFHVVIEIVAGDA